MKVKIQFYFLVLLFFLGYNSIGQVVEVTQSFSSGVQAPVVGSVIKAPGQGSNGQINITNTANVQYKARDIVHLKDGFHAGEFTGNGLFHAYIDPSQILPADYSGGLLDNQEFEEREINTSKAVGYIPATYNVSPTGAATYTIPIQIPPGTAGMVPSLSVGYSSQSGNGILGWGWRIGGISNISRVPKTIYYNGKVEPVKLDETDDFSLNGQRLILEGDVFYPESESFSRTFPIGTSGSGPESFLVNSKNGTKTFYGLTPDSRFKKDGTNEVLFWLISKVEDSHGNYITYSYRQVNHEVVIDKISYTGNDEAGISPFNTINFFYDERTDKNTVYLAGTAIESNLLLSKIKINADGQNFKTYKFNYGLNQYSFLKEVQEFGSDDSEINSTVFKYGDSKDALVKNPSNLTLTDENTYIIGDFNGDGFEDLIKSPIVIIHEAPEIKANSNLEIYYNSGTEIGPSPQTVISLDNGTIASLNFSNKSKNSIIKSDFNGDGFDDVLVVKYNFEGNVFITLTKIDYFRVYLGGNNGLSNNNYIDFNLPDGCDYIPINLSSFPILNTHLLIGDLNGDGSTDIFSRVINSLTGSVNCFVTQLTNGVMIKPALFESETVLEQEVTSDLLIQTALGNVFTLDLDNDSKHEILVLEDFFSQNQQIDLVFIGEENESSFVFVKETLSVEISRYIGDFNGDGLFDFFMIDNDGANSHSLISKGDKTYEAIPVPLAFPFNAENDSIIVIDFNLDGKTDLLHFLKVTHHLSPPDSHTAYSYPDQYQLVLYLSNGLNFNEPQELLVLSPDLKLIFGGENDALQSTIELVFEGLNIKKNFFIDLNGDNKMDFIPYKNVDEVALGSSSYIFYKDDYRLLLSDVADGFLRKYHFKYKPFPLFGVSSTFSNVFPVKQLKNRLILVGQVIEQFNNQFIKNIFFDYSKGRLNTTGKGFLGFQFVTESIPEFNLKTVSEYDYDLSTFTPFVIKKSGSLLTDLTPIFESQYDFQIENIGSTKRYKMKLLKEVNSNFLEGKKQITEYSYDDFLNTTMVLNSWENTDEWHKVEYLNYLQVNGTVPNKPQKIRSMDYRTGHSFSKETSFTYTLEGSLETQTEFSDKAQKLISTYTYDAFGNTKTKTLTTEGSNLTTIFTKADYDIKGRFPIKTYNPLNQTSEYTYDNRWGKVLSAKGISGLVSTFEYDGWGRLKKSTDPLGLMAQVNYFWALNSGVDNAIYYSQNVQTATPPFSEFYDAIGRMVFTSTKGLNDQIIVSSKTYNEKGFLRTESSPHTLNETPVITTYTYDGYNRPTNISNGASNISYTYNITNGLLEFTQTNPANQSSTKVTDATGKVVFSIDQGGTLEYTYDGTGNLLSTKTPGSTTNLVTLTYDLNYGTQTSLVDANGGPTIYQYNLLGQLVSQTDALGKVSTLEYDILGRPTSKTVDNEITNYQYYNSGNGLNQIKKISSSNGSFQEFAYDNFERCIQFKEKQGNFSDVFTTAYNYNSFGQLGRTTYPSGFATIYSYDANGYMTTINDAANQPIFTASEANGRGQLSKYTLGNNKTTQKTYNQYGFLERTYTSGIQDLETVFNLQTGNLELRQDNIKGLNELFNYDELDRLIHASPSNTNNGLSIADNVHGPFDELLSYASNGNINSKTGLGQYQYESTKPNALTSVDNNHYALGLEPLISLNQQNVAYQNDRPVTIKENGYCYRMYYGVDDQRFVSELRQDNPTTPEPNDSTLLSQRFYSINYEQLETITGDKYQINYIPSPDGLIAIYVTHTPLLGEQQEDYYYVYKDHLGSILTLTGENGNIVYEQNFDAWGNRRNADTWAFEYTSLISSQIEIESWFNRGYTGHEHLREFGLINMNARLYDPLIGRFLAVDNFVQDPYSTQGYNRYSYCMNNPLKYTDPSGELIEIENELRFAVTKMGAPWDGFMKFIGDLFGYDWGIHTHRFTPKDRGKDTEHDKNGDNGQPEKLPQEQPKNDGQGLVDYANNLQEGSLMQASIQVHGLAPNAEGGQLGGGATIEVPKETDIANVDYNHFPKIGDQVKEPLNGVWDYTSAFLFGNTYGGFNVGSDGRISGYAPITGEASMGGTGGGYTVYQGIKNGKVVYWGLTKNLKQRIIQHGKKNFDDIFGVYEKLSYEAARGLEQVMIDKFGIKNLENIRNGIGVQNKKMMEYYQEAIRHLKQKL